MHWFPGSHDDWLGLNRNDDDKVGKGVDREVDNGRHGGSSWWGNIGSKDSLEDIAAAVSAVWDDEIGQDEDFEISDQMEEAELWARRWQEWVGEKER